MIDNNPLHANSYAVADFLMDTVQPRTALDIGANIGGMTNIMLQHGLAPIHAFEPVPSVFETLFKAHGQDRRVICENLGVSNAAGVVKDVTVLCAWTIGTPEETKTLAVSPEFVGTPRFDMHVTTIDEVCRRLNLSVGFIKLDVDGYEFRVLKGGQQTLLEQRPPIMCEFASYVDQLRDSVPDFLDYIFWLGYDVFSMDGKYLFKSPKEIAPYYPWHTSFDVMLIPRFMTRFIKERFGTND